MSRCIPWLYVLLVITTFGFVWHRDCNVNSWDWKKNERSQERDVFLSTFCAVPASFASPIYWPLKISAIILDPKTSLPGIKFN